MIKQKLNKKAKIEYKPLHPADMKATWADITKAKKLLDWQPNIYLEQGIEQTVQWFIGHHTITTKISFA